MKLNSIKFGVVPVMAPAMTACSSEIDVCIPQSNTYSNQIGYYVVTNNMTRATASYCNNVQPERFKVVAYDGASNYFGTDDEGNGVVDEIVKQEDGSWSHKDAVKRYWPDGKPDSWEGMTFYAYLSSSEQSATAAENEDCGFTLPEAGSDGTHGTAKFEHFEVKSSVAEQHDLMYAVVKGAKKKSDKNGSVTLNFRHALSQICFTAQNANPTLKDITIKSITVGGVYGKGTYTFPEETSMNSQGSHPNYSYIDKTSVNDWEFADDAELTSYTVDFTTAASEGASATGGISLGAVLENEENGAIVNLTKPVYTNEGETEEATDHAKTGIFEKAMNLLPQEQEAAAYDGATSGAYFKVTALLTNVDAAEDEDPVERTVFIPVSIDWKENIRYTYNLKWTPTEIIYEPSFADYNDIESEELISDSTPYKKICMRKSSGEEGSDDYVSALYFADRNIGSVNEQDPGTYFWWGDVEGHYFYNNRLYKEDGTPESDLLFFCPDNCITYNKSRKTLLDAGIINSEYILNNEYDAAFVKMGSDWRIPTSDELRWLTEKDEATQEYKNCTWERKEANDGKLVGYTVTSKTTYNSIYLPVTGSFIETGFNISGESRECGALYWSSKCPQSETQAARLRFNDAVEPAVVAGNRYSGYPIRAVSDSE